MTRFIITCVITVVLGVGVYLVVDFIGKNNGEDVPVNEEIEETMQIDVYQNKITMEELMDIAIDAETLVVFVGNQEDEATINVGTVLSSIPEIETFPFYYLEKEELDASLYQSLLISYPELENYINFTPVILVFKNNILFGGLPGEVEKRNVIQFFEYAELM